MSSWRTFLLVVLLALSLPIPSFAAASMPCGGSPGASAWNAAGAGNVHDPAGAHAMPGAQGDRPDRASHARHAMSCTGCVSCCFGAAAPGEPGIAAPADASRAIVSTSPPAAAVSFLTGGIERPPRALLAV
ncbi:hypothetical protein ACVBGC_30225 [Burkholderia stagnalis]